MTSNMSLKNSYFIENRDQIVFSPFKSYLISNMLLKTHALSKKGRSYSLLEGLKWYHILTFNDLFNVKNFQRLMWCHIWPFKELLDVKKFSRIKLMSHKFFRNENIYSLKLFYIVNTLKKNFNEKKEFIHKQV